MIKEVKRFLGVLVATFILSVGSVTTIASASTDGIIGEKGIEEITPNAVAVASKYIQMPWLPTTMPIKYLYDDGVYRGYLYLAGVFYDKNGTDLAGGWLEGTVYCYKNCPLN